MSQRFKGVIINGKLSITNRDAFLNYIRGFEDSNVVLSVKVLQGTRTPPQNSYYYGVVVKVLGDNFGYTKDEMHKALKVHFGIDSTKTLSVDEFDDYIQRVMRWAQIEHGVYIPEPK